MGWGVAVPGGGGNGGRGGRGADLEDERVAQHAEPDHPQPLVLRARACLGQSHRPPPGPRSAARHGAGGPVPLRGSLGSPGPSPGPGAGGGVGGPGAGSGAVSAVPVPVPVPVPAPVPGFSHPARGARGGIRLQATGGAPL